MGAHYELRGSVYPRTTDIIDAYPDRDKAQRLKDWAASLAIRDLCTKLAGWTEEDAGRHVHQLERFFAEREKPRKEQDHDLVQSWSGVVDAHKRAHREVLEFLAEAGTLGHDYIEQALRLSMADGYQFDGLASKEDPNAETLRRYALNAAANWGRWFEERARPGGFKPVAVELKLISPTLKFGGTPDCLAMFKGGLWLFDWKTSRSINRIAHGMQTAAYLALVEEECVWQDGKIVQAKEGEAVRIDGCAIVRVDRIETAFEHYEVPEGRIGPMWEMFVKLLEVVEHKAAFERAIRGIK